MDKVLLLPATYGVKVRCGVFLPLPVLPVLSVAEGSVVEGVEMTCLVVIICP